MIGILMKISSRWKKFLKSFVCELFCAKKEKSEMFQQFKKIAISMVKEIEYQRTCDETILPNIVLIRFCL